MHFAVFRAHLRWDTVFRRKAPVRPEDLEAALRPLAAWHARGRMEDETASPQGKACSNFQVDSVEWLRREVHTFRIWNFDRSSRSQISVIT